MEKFGLLKLLSPLTPQNNAKDSTSAHLDTAPPDKSRCVNAVNSYLNFMQRHEQHMRRGKK